MEDKLKQVGLAYEKGLTCSQAVFCAYTKDMGIDETTACRMMEGFGGGFGGMQEVCGALTAATAIISFYSSGERPGMVKNVNRSTTKCARLQSFFGRNTAASPAGRFCTVKVQRHFNAA